jgi:signal transduction histidine kinase
MKKILVIEDSRSTRESTLNFLTAHGFAAIAAENGRQGIAIAHTYLPDMVLCDVMMPELDGYHVLSALRQHPLTATTPFIFLTARSTKEDFRQGMELGADDYLTKPFTSVELLAAITSRFAKYTTVVDQSQKQLQALRSSIALSLPHELRTPLHGILGLAEVLIEDHEKISPTEVLEIAEGIHQAADRLYRLTQNFLLYAELELALRDPEHLKFLCSGETQYPNVLITNVATQVARRCDRLTDLQLNLQNTALKISDVKLKKIVEELTENAFKFSQPQTPVSITAIANHTGLAIYISDHGRGMSAGQIAELGAYMQFERRFYEQQGSGLGLAIAKRLVELHGGTLDIESVLGHHTTVQVTLPGSSDSRSLDS